MAREIIWQGKKEEEVQKMSMDEFLNLIPSRQRRSLKREFTSVQKSLLKKIKKGENNIKTHCRDLVILPSMIGKTLKIYNGKEFISVTITLEMMGHYLGEFSHTRKIVSHSAAGVGATRSSKAISAR